MGDRISIQFERNVDSWANGKPTKWNVKSPCLFSHWGGMEFLDKVAQYRDELIPVLEGEGDPIDRLEPGTVMVDFVRWLTKDEERITHNLYLTCKENEGDNSDNGHHVINLDAWNAMRNKPAKERRKAR